MIAYEVGRDGFINKHIRTIRKVYSERRDLMLDCMEKFFPEGVTWTRPEGGLFLWVTLHEGIDTSKLLIKALEEKVAFVPGAPFHASGGGENTLRLNFSNATHEQITAGIERLGRAIAHEIGTTATAPAFIELESEIAGIGA